MKTLIFALVLCLSMAMVAQGGMPITVVNPGFEDPCHSIQVNGFDGQYGGLPNVPGWEDDCDVFPSPPDKPRSGVLAPGQNSYTGDYCGFLVNVAAYAENIVWQLTDKTIAAGEVYTFSVWVWEQWQYDAQVKLSFFYDDGLGNHTEVASNTVYVIDNSTWNNYSATFTVEDGAAAIGKKLGIAIEHVTQETLFWMSYDDVTLEQVLVSNPDPCDGEPLVVVTTNLEWDLESIVTNCDVYFGSDPNFINNPKVVDGQTQGKVELYDPPDDLANETTYYWRVDARVGATVYEGDIWEFTTIVAEPVITEDPCGLTVNAGETAVFRVKVTNVDSYLWKRLDDSPIPDNTGATLTITDVQKADEDVYWCELTNTVATIKTASVNLMTRRLVALWEFEDSLEAEDNEENACWLGDYVDPNTENPDPTPVYALDDPCSTGNGKSLQLVADKLHVRITGSKDFFNFYPQGYTVNIWVKTGQANDYGAMASKQRRIEAEWPDWYGWVLSCTDEGKVVNTLRQINGAKSTIDIADNQWHMITGTYDAEAGVVAVYVDGLVKTESEPSSDIAPTNGYPVVLGAETNLGEVAYEGLLDKTSIYSYALSQIDVAVLYTDVMGGSLCVGGNPEYDLNDDCKVDILDFALFAADWLECNLVPTCLP